MLAEIEVCDFRMGAGGTAAIVLVLSPHTAGR